MAHTEDSKEIPPCPGHPGSFGFYKEGLFYTPLGALGQELVESDNKYKVRISSSGTPKDCSLCHPEEVTQCSRSRHANIIDIILTKFLRYL
jgi:hypothetical protein